MRTFAIVFLLTALCASSMAQCGPPDLPHYITYKTFYTALLECSEYYSMGKDTVDDYIRSGYPNAPDTNRLLHCAMVDLGMWSDSTGGKDYVISYYFQPNPNDADYAEHTRQCISSALGYVDPCDQNTRAYLTFSCYLSNYGCLVGTAQFVPLTQNEFFELLLFLVNAWRISPETLQTWGQGNYIDDPMFKNALWTFGIRSGLVHCTTGVDLDLGYMQYGFPQLISPDTRCCVANVNQQYSNVDKREQFYWVYRICMDSFLKPVLLAAVNGVLSGAASLSASAAGGYGSPGNSIPTGSIPANSIPGYTY